MEEYTRDSLRQLRRTEFEAPVPQKGSRWITLLIILLFLFAGGFYLSTQKDFSFEDAKDTLLGWKEEVAAVWNQSSQEIDIEKTVDDALTKQDGDH
ncbi:MAG: hypothetical protein IJN80_01650 [Clostridia bacterium]|nr:hypothetical protein [Clostridia bacterium]